MSISSAVYVGFVIQEAGSWFCYAGYHFLVFKAGLYLANKFTYDSWAKVAPLFTQFSRSGNMLARSHFPNLRFAGEVHLIDNFPHTKLYDGEVRSSTIFIQPKFEESPKLAFSP